MLNLQKGGTTRDPERIRSGRSRVTRKKTVRAPGLVQPAVVSVVIPCFNYMNFLPMAVESVVSQAGVGTEVIIVDDCSTDGSLRVANELASAHSGVQVFSLKVNSGPVTAFNTGLAAATGEFLVRLDADDMLTPGSLARAVAVLQEHESVGLVYGRPLHFSGDRLPKARMSATKLTLWPGANWLENRCRDGLNVITSPEVVMRKSIVDQVGGQMPLAHTHDMEMWFRVAAFSDIAYLRGCDQAWHRDHDESLSARLVDKKTDLSERRLAFDVLFSGLVATQPWSSRMRDLSNRAIDANCFAFARHELDKGVPEPALVDSLLEQVRSLERADISEKVWIRAQMANRRALRRRTSGYVRRGLGRVRAECAKRRWRKYGEY